MKDTVYKEFWNIASSYNYILLVSHKNPDGDTLGSVLALYDVLKRERKRVYLYNATEDLPPVYGFLPNFNRIKNILPKRFDLVISCDCADFGRMGISDGSYKLVNIDHHLSNSNFGDLNIVEDKFASTGEIVFNILEYNSLHISKDAAECLYASIAEDSGFFRYPRVDSKTFDICSKLVSFGVSPYKTALKLKGEESLSKIRLLGYIYNEFELLNNATVSYIYLPKEAFERSGARVDDTKNMAALLLDIANVKVAVMITQKKDGTKKVSLRSKESVNVLKVALEFEGGGHPNAAGFEVDKKVEEKDLKKEIIEKVKEII